MVLPRNEPPRKSKPSDSVAAQQRQLEAFHLPADGPLTTQQGVVFSDNHNSLRAGPRGALLLEDMVLREKIFHFDHERIPERVVHARGLAAHGYFELAHSLAELTMAQVLGEVGHRTSVFVRFSTVAGNRGSADLARDVGSDRLTGLARIGPERILELTVELGR